MTPSSRSPPISRSCAAPRARRSCSSRRSSSASRRSASPTATRSPASCAPTRPRRKRASASSSAAGSISPTAPSLLVYPTDRAAYSRLCRLLSIGKSRGGQGQVPPRLGRCRRLERGPARDPARRRGGRRPRREPRAPQGNLRQSRLHGADPPLRAQRASPALLRRAGGAGREGADGRHGRRALPPPRSRRRLQDVGLLHPPGLHHRRGRLSGSSVMPTAISRIRSRWSGCSSAIPKRSAAFGEILDRCTFSLDELRYQYPSETEPGETAQEKLERLTWDGHGQALPGRHSRCGRDDLPARAAPDRGAWLRAVLPHRPRHRRVRQVARHPVPGPRLGGELRRLLRARHHRRSIRPSTTCCSSASSPRSGASRRTSTSTSSTSGARR